MGKLIYQMKLVVVVLFLSALISMAKADDTDIYVGASSTSAPPLVMFSLDYRSNLGSSVCGGTECDSLVSEGYLASAPTTRFELLRAVLRKTLDGMGDMQVGLMMNHAHANNCAGPSDSNCSGGGYMVGGFKPIVTLADATADPTTYAAEIANKQAFHDALTAMPIPGGSTAHSYQGKELFFELFRYLTGQDTYSGHLGFKDYGDNNQTTNLDTDFPAIKRDMSIESDGDSDYDTPGTYTTPITENCSKIFTINFMFQVSSQEDDADSAIVDTQANGGMSTSSGTIDISGSHNNFSSVLDWLHNIDLADGTFGTAPNVTGEQNITSYFIVEPTHINTTTRGYATAGGTTAPYEWSDNPDELIDTLQSIFKQILSVSTTFTAASVPVSMLNRAQVVDNVYIALFKADAGGNVRWPGNLKKLRLDTVNGILVDAANQAAVSIDGRIKYDALTYWTTAGSLPAADASNNEVPGKDGRAVKRGGAGQKMPGFIADDPGINNTSTNGRRLYYEPSSGTTLSNINADASTATTLQAALTATDATESLKILKYIRGYDVNDEDSDSSFTDVRPWVLGDPLHSRPLPINYGARGSFTATNPDIRIIMGTNDGMLHMFQNTIVGGGESGAESWAYMPQQVMPKIKTLMNNPASTHVYTVDGAPAAYIDDTDNDGVIETGEHAWVFFGLRRGGRGVYALDITDPDAPVKLWSKTEADLPELGYTFSTPRIGKLDWGSGKKPVVIFAGGYDTNKDTYATNDSMGRAIFILDAETGDLIWKAVKGASTGNVSSTEYNRSDMDDSIPSPVTAIDTTGNGMIDRIYVGDTGGRVWRVDLPLTYDGFGVALDNRTNWTITKFASVGRHNVSGPSNDRRFFHEPDFVGFKDDTGPYDAVIIGSGNRADPLEDTVNNYFYMMKDRYITSGTPSAAFFSYNSFDDVTDNCLQDSSCSGSGPSLSNGWRMELAVDGEKNLATPTTLDKKIYMTTYSPPDGSGTSCAPSEGSGRLYALSLINATAVKDYSVVNGSAIETLDRYRELDSGGIPAEVVYLPFDKILTPDLQTEDIGAAARWKTYWFFREN